MSPTRDENGSRWVLYGTGISNNVAWEWEMMWSARNGNGNGNGNGSRSHVLSSLVFHQVSADIRPNSITYFHTPEVCLVFPIPALLSRLCFLRLWTYPPRMAEEEEEQIYRRHWTGPTCVCCVRGCRARLLYRCRERSCGCETSGWWDACRHLCGYRLSEPNSY